MEHIVPTIIFIAIALIIVALLFNIVDRKSTRLNSSHP